MLLADDIFLCMILPTNVRDFGWLVGHFFLQDLSVHRWAKGTAPFELFLELVEVAFEKGCCSNRRFAWLFRTCDW